MKRSKLYTARREAVERTRNYPLDEALQTLKDMQPCNFDETVEMSFRLGVDPRQSDQLVRGALVLPHGTGKTVRVVVAADGEAADAAREAGADEVGMSDLLERIQGGWLEFDSMIATPEAMKEVRKLGRVLGPRGLMPNPKTGTVTEDTATAVKEAKAGQVQYRTDRGGCVHVPIGKKSFSVEALQENAEAVVEMLSKARPTGVKGAFFRGLAVSLTMSPGIKVDLRNLGRAQ
ncbi:MAG: 50S ribosomal protein L1 [Verrucomicrobiota bacterium]